MASRSRSESDAAVSVLDSTGATLSGSAGTLLTERLLAAAGYFGSGLHVMRSLSPGGLLTEQCIEDGLTVDFDGEDAVSEFDFADLLAVKSNTSHFALIYASFFSKRTFGSKCLTFFVVVLTTTKPLFGPGTLPLANI